MHKPLLLALLLTPAACLFAQSGVQAVRLAEVFPPGSQYYVSCRVQINGLLTVPAEMGKKQLPLTGSSALDYEERVLTEKNGVVEKTIRAYRKMEFLRKVGDEEQQSTLRPEVRRLVILRHNQLEVPFSPTGPLTWGEIDLVRTDVFTPALAGLLPAQAARPGERWQAAATAVKELTDLERIDEGQLTCTFDTLSTLLGRQQARVSLQGTVRGVGEDGPAKHQIEGHLYFDLVSNHLSYLYVKGTHFLLDKNGQDLGKIDGTFTLTREPLTTAKDLTDADLRGLTLEPNDDNTMLLFDQPEVGARFLYPRRWKLAGANGKQIALDEKKGSGILITLESAAKTPTGPQYHDEVRGWLVQQKAIVLRMDQPRPAGAGLDHFAVDAELTKQRQYLEYYVVRQSTGGATVVARIMPGDWANLRKDVERIVRSLQIQVK